MALSSTRRRGFSLPEVLVVIGVIVVLIGLLLPALAGVRKSGQMASSMSNMRQIAEWMTMYAKDNRETIVPSQFDYSGESYPGKVRSVVGAQQQGQPHQGTWSDILWTVYKVGVFPEAEATLGSNYRFDSPDAALYEHLGQLQSNPLRSAAPNSRNAVDGDLPRPYGDGALESGLPGFFAANDFFNARPDGDGAGGSRVPGWYVTSQIPLPARSMYLVDSFYGETIRPVAEPFDSVPADADSEPTIEVDFRYADTCLMLFLDGHVSPENPWENLENLQCERGIRVQYLDQRSLPPGACP